MATEVEQLLIELRQESDLRRKRTRILYWFLGSAFGFLVLAWIAVFIKTGETPDLSTTLPLLVFGTGLAMAHTQKHKSLVAELAARKDPRILGELLEAAYSSEPDVQQLATSALPAILEVWLTSDSPEITPEHRALLYRLLDPIRPFETVESVLAAVTAVGGIEAVPYLESLERKTAKHKQSRWQRVSTKCLEALAEVRFREARRIIDTGPTQEKVEVLEQRA